MQLSSFVIICFHLCTLEAARIFVVKLSEVKGQILFFLLKIKKNWLKITIKLIAYYCANNDNSSIKAKGKGKRTV